VKFDTLKFDDEKFKGIKSTLSVLNKEFKIIISEIQYSLLDNKVFTFQFNELQVKDIFGSYMEV
jgi:hypothetical protein